MCPGPTRTISPRRRPSSGGSTRPPWAPRRATAFGARAVLTLPGDYEAPSRLGLDDFDAEAYEEVLERLAGHGPAHWIGGHAVGVQGHPPEEDSTLLFYVEWDEELGFEFLDGGSIQFRIPAKALRERDWGRIVAVADSS